MKNNCIFCAIAAGEIPSFKVYEDDLVLAYLDINPFSFGHTLVIPKAHSAGLLDTPPDALKEIVAAASLPVTTPLALIAVILTPRPSLFVALTQRQSVRYPNSPGSE